VSGLKPNLSSSAKTASRLRSGRSSKTSRTKALNILAFCSWGMTLTAASPCACAASLPLASWAIGPGSGGWMVLSPCPLVRVVLESCPLVKDLLRQDPGAGFRDQVVDEKRRQAVH